MRTVLFCDTFVHTPSTAEQQNFDTIKFKQDVVIEELRIVRDKAMPHPNKLKFVGHTQPGSFHVEVFSKLRTESHWDQMAAPFVYKEGQVDRIFPHHKDSITHEILLRGDYTTLSLCIYGATRPTQHSTQPVQPTQPTLQQLSTQPPASPQIVLTQQTSSIQPTASLHHSHQDSGINSGANGATREDIEVLGEHRGVEPIVEYDLLGSISELQMSALSNIEFPPMSREDYGDRRISTGATFLDLCSKASRESDKDRVSTLKEMATRLPLKPHKDNLPQLQRWLSFVAKWIVQALNGYNSLVEEIQVGLNLASVIFKSHLTFAADFVASGGMEKLCEIIESPHHSSAIKTSTFHTLKNALAHEATMERYIYFNGQGVVDGAYIKLEPEESVDHPDNYSGTLYQRLLQLLNTSRSPRVMLLGKGILQQVYVYHRFKTLKTMISQIELGEVSTKLWRNLAVTLQEISTIVQHSSSQFSNEEDPVSHLVQRSWKPSLFESSDFAAHFVTMLSSSNLLCSITKILVEPSLSNLPGGIQERVLLGVKEILFHLLSCRGGLYYLANNTELVLEIINATHDPNSKVEDLPGLVTCLKAPKKTQMSHISHLLAYHLKSLLELDKLMDSGIDDAVTPLKNLYNMAVHDIGKQAVISTLSQVDGLSVVLSELDLPANEIELKNSVAGQYAASLLLLVLQSEHSADFVAKEGPVISEAMNKLDGISLTSELKGKVQQISDWLRPSITLKEKDVDGLVESLKLILPVESIDENEISDFVGQSLSRSSILTLTSTLQLLSLAAKNYPTVVVNLYAQDVVSDFVKIIRLCVSALTAEKDGVDSKAFTIIRREHQHLRLLIPCLNILQCIIDWLHSSSSNVSTYRNTPLVEELLKLSTAISGQATFAAAVPPFSPSGHTLLVNRVNSFLLYIFNSWQWAPILPKILDHLLWTPKNYFSGIHLLLSLLSSKDLSAWAPELEKEIEKLLWVVSPLIVTSCKSLYKLVVRLSCILVETSIVVGKHVVIEPLIEALKREIPNFRENAEPSSLLIRLMNLTFNIARMPAGKALLLQSNSVDLITPLLSSSSAQLNGLSFAVLCCYCSMSIRFEEDVPFEISMIEDVPSSEELKKLINALLGILVSAEFPIATTSLFILLSLSYHSYGSFHILTAETENESPMVKFLSRLQESCGICTTSELKESFEITIIFLQMLCSSNANRMKDIRSFLCWKPEDSKSHPLSLLIQTLEDATESFDGKKLRSQEMGIPEMKERLSNITERLNFITELDEQEEEEEGPNFPQSRPLEERFLFRQWEWSWRMLNFYSGKEVLLDESDFAELVPADAALSLGETEENEEASATQVLPTALKRPPVEGISGPPLKKQKADSSGQAFTQYTYTTRRDPFRNRKPNTSRPPSVHVDDFLKPKSKPEPKLMQPPALNLEETGDKDRNWGWQPEGQPRWEERKQGSPLGMNSHERWDVYNPPEMRRDTAPFDKRTMHMHDEPFLDIDPQRYYEEHQRHTHLNRGAPSGLQGPTAPKGRRYGAPPLTGARWDPPGPGYPRGGDQDYSYYPY